MGRAQKNESGMVSPLLSSQHPGNLSLAPPGWEG